MKSATALFLLMFSVQSFAFSSITVSKEITLTKNSYSKSLFALSSAGKGSDYCQLSLNSNDNSDTLVVKAGTVFEVTSLDQNGCGHDWGHVCRLDLSARNQEINVNASLVCKDKGLLAKELTIAKVNKTSKNLLIVK